MVKGIGTDLVSLVRIEKALDRHGERFAKRILTGSEYQQFLTHAHKSNFLAKRFAAKEAVVKALGTGFSMGITWQDIQVEHFESGQPCVVLMNKALERFDSKACQQILLSITDEDPYIAAFVIIE